MLLMVRTHISDERRKKCKELKFLMRKWMVGLVGDAQEIKYLKHVDSDHENFLIIFLGSKDKLSLFKHTNTPAQHFYRIDMFSGKRISWYMFRRRI